MLVVLSTVDGGDGLTLVEKIQEIFPVIVRALADQGFRLLAPAATGLASKAIKSTAKSHTSSNSSLGVRLAGRRLIWLALIEGWTPRRSSSTSNAMGVAVRQGI
jgi:hypothetical protein